MNEIRTLMEKFWICRDSDKETFYKVKRDIPNFQRFIREQLGWKLIHTEKLLKLEKRPAHAEAFMGINEFTDIRDYCILCVVLMYLEDAEEGKQFLLSELIDYVETHAGGLDFFYTTKITGAGIAVYGTAADAPGIRREK